MKTLFPLLLLTLLTAGNPAHCKEAASTWKEKSMEVFLLHQQGKYHEALEAVSPDRRRLPGSETKARSLSSDKVASKWTKKQSPRLNRLSPAVRFRLMLQG
jgi:hypothetical protein